MQQGVKKALERLYMNKMSHFEIYKKNQVLYIEYGFIYVTLLFFMMFLPFKGVTNLISFSTHMLALKFDIYLVKSYEKVISKVINYFYALFK